MTLTYRSITAMTRVLVRIFLREVEVTGEKHVPETGGGVVVAGHPNGLVDPILILSYFPRPIVFGARHGLFRWPLLGWIMRQFGTVPPYRAVDTTGAQSNQNRRAGNKKALVKGSNLAIHIVLIGYPIPVYKKTIAVKGEADERTNFTAAGVCLCLEVRKQGLENRFQQNEFGCHGWA